MRKCENRSPELAPRSIFVTSIVDRARRLLLNALQETTRLIEPAAPQLVTPRWIVLPCPVLRARRSALSIERSPARC